MEKDVRSTSSVKEITRLPRRVSKLYALECRTKHNDFKQMFRSSGCKSKREGAMFQGITDMTAILNMTNVQYSYVHLE